MATKTRQLFPLFVLSAIISSVTAVYYDVHYDIGVAIILSSVALGLFTYCWSETALTRRLAIYASGFVMRSKIMYLLFCVFVVAFTAIIFGYADGDSWALYSTKAMTLSVNFSLAISLFVWSLVLYQEARQELEELRSQSNH